MGAQRILLTWGVLWLVVTLCGGIYLGPQVNPTRAAKETHLVNALQGLSAGDTARAETELREGIAVDRDFSHLVSVHSHAACMAFLAILLGLTLPFMGLADKTKTVLACFLVVGSLVHEVGVLTEAVSITAGSIMAGTGAVLIIASGGVALVGIVRYANS